MDVASACSAIQMKAPFFRLGKLLRGRGRGFRAGYPRRKETQNLSEGGSCREREDRNSRLKLETLLARSSASGRPAVVWPNEREAPFSPARARSPSRREQREVKAPSVRLG